MSRQVRGTVNAIELIGYLGADPDQRVLASGARVSSFTVATKHLGGRGEGSERSVETDWTTVEVWDRLAELCGNALHKGSRVRVTGSLRSQSWDDKETGQRRYKTVVRAEGVLVLDARPGQTESAEAPEAVDEGEEVPF
ncbi:MAG: single-stranded DNA-binding protein [Chloroflexales bacterium]|nr:single-stranded DNA-binding protein [Chloroflexales bacterium]